MLKTFVRHPLTNITLFAGQTRQGIVIAAVEFGLKKRYSGIDAQASNNPLLREYSRMMKGFLDGRCRLTFHGVRRFKRPCWRLRERSHGGVLCHTATSA
jgi:hypothetical protein